MVVAGDVVVRVGVDLVVGVGFVIAESEIVFLTCNVFEHCNVHLMNYHANIDTNESSSLGLLRHVSTA